MKSLLIAASAVAVLAGAASAQEGPMRLGAGYQAIDTGSATYDALTFRGSFDINEIFAVEGDVMFGVGDETVRVGTTSVRSEMNYGVGAYGVARMPVGEQFTVFGRAGYTYFDARTRGVGVGFSGDVGGWAFGGGAEWAFAGPNAVRVDYTRYDFVNGKGKADAFGVSFVRRF